MSFGFVVGEGAGVNAKASRLQMPRLWDSSECRGTVRQERTGSYLRQAVCPRSRYGSSSRTHWTLQATCSYFSAAGQWMTVGSVFM